MSLLEKCKCRNDESRCLLLVHRCCPFVFVASPLCTASDAKSNVIPLPAVQVVKVLQALGRLEAWLESAELSVRETALAGDPGRISMAGSRSCLPETEVVARLAELRTMRLEVEGLHSRGHPHGPSLQARMETLEQK